MTWGYVSNTAPRIYAQACSRSRLAALLPCTLSAGVCHVSLIDIRTPVAVIPCISGARGHPISTSFVDRDGFITTFLWSKLSNSQLDPELLSQSSLRMRSANPLRDRTCAYQVGGQLEVRYHSRADLYDSRFKNRHLTAARWVYYSDFQNQGCRAKHELL